jgi:hypothetical protein
LEASFKTWLNVDILFSLPSLSTLWMNLDNFSLIFIDEDEACVDGASIPG